jgi:medium-chain acyl-[acyl-carrier-protein] hydrolase
MTNNPKFNLDFRIGFNGLLPDNSISLPALMDCVQETSLLHTHSIPGAMDYYDEMNMAWVLTHWQVELYAAAPKLGDIINISTWPVGFKGYFGTRGYEAKNVSGNTILAANSNWILLDRNSLKPVRPTEFIATKYGGLFDFPLNKDFTLPEIKSTETANFEHLSTHKYIPTRRDMDTNNHVNNISYLKWLYDLIPEDLYQNSRPRSLKVAYKKETLLGDELIIKLYKRLNTKTEQNIEILAIIEKGGKVATEIYIVW